MSIPRRLTVRTHLLLGNLALTVTALGVTWAVIALIGPSLFRNHIERGAPLPPEVLDRAETAFHIANLIEVVVAAGVAFLLTLGLSVLVTRPVRRTATAMASTLARLTASDYTARLPVESTVTELAALAVTVNSMAETIQRTEATRRRLLTDLAHEMRTPLATIDGFLEAIQDGIETADPATLAILRQQAQKLTRLADDLKAISAAEEHRLDLTLRPVPVDRLIRDAADALSRAYQAKGVALRVQPAAPTVVHVDAQRINQVLTNLLTNALRHTPAGGQVTLTAGESPGGVQITVRDTGEGIAAEHLPFLFERFYRAHRRTGPGGGSGLGLTISRAIVTAHAGTVTVASAGPGQGTTAQVTLPASPPGSAG
ncbi:HAMP domain-containing histidine kinase [Dactylosporangium aurantiacum]|uniref:histidine kinase n=1 Tax=Dactylosporangium aurantiacum TaxID=35754 RepID=A0A9Q9IPJ7_9ACTN|nr:ATP-binding protein [Dactylosporangium aurantiacum]MDG6103936.1 ATP-binding protein [Dactylosporangium aurantiacum]UWZ58878.1 HAMP domain-containing histidine kinase [Dactylosporangium aurantiacum]